MPYVLHDTSDEESSLSESTDAALSKFGDAKVAERCSSCEQTRPCTGGMEAEIEAWMDCER
eukprot:1547042-Rhodomonas_salina.2